jgi:Sulfotransferase family
MQNVNENTCKYVFVCGLQRSGTSMLGRNISRLENCTGFKNTGVLQDEGQYLQDVYATDQIYGGTGRYGFDPRAHLTETSELLTPENIARLRASWHAHWDNNKTICVEKTPGNLLMTRFLQAAFPKSYFVVLKRHPIAVSMATQRWKVSVTAIHRLFEHWLHCYGIFNKDKKYLKHVYELGYEDYVEHPDKYHQEIARFIGTTVPESPKDDEFRYVTQWPPTGLRVPERAMEQTSRAYNEKYLNRWRDLITSSPFKSYYRYLTAKYEPRVTKHGYSLVANLPVTIEELRAGKLSNAVGTFCCIGADIGTFLQRLFVRSKPKIRILAKAVLPAFVTDWVRKARQRKANEQNRELVVGKREQTARM